MDSQEEEEEEEREEESGTAHRCHVATPWASHRLVLGRGGMWQDKKVPRRPCLPTQVITPWETRRLVWDKRWKIWGIQKPIDISGTSDEDDSADEKGNELQEEDGRDARARRPATPLIPRWSIGAPRYSGMPQLHPNYKEQMVCALTATLNCAACTACQNFSIKNKSTIS